MATPFPPFPNTPHAPTATTRGIVDHLLGALADMRRLAIDHLELCTLEARRAALTLVGVIAVAFGVAVLAMTTWMALVSLALVAWTNAGHGWMSGLAIAAARACGDGTGPGGLDPQSPAAHRVPRDGAPDARVAGGAPMTDVDLQVPDTPEAIESRMRATRSSLRAHADLAAHGFAERTRRWPMWLAGSAALAGLALGLGRGSRGTPAAPARATPSAKAAGLSFAALAGWALRIAPLVRNVLHHLRAQSR